MACQIENKPRSSGNFDLVVYIRKYFLWLIMTDLIRLRQFLYPIWRSSKDKRNKLAGSFTFCLALLL